MSALVRVCAPVLVAASVWVTGCANTSGSSATEAGGARAPLMAAQDDVSRIVALVAPGEVATLAADPAVATKRSVDFEEGLAKGLSACLSDAGVDGSDVEEFVAAKEGSIAFGEGDPLSREYVELYGFGIVDGPSEVDQKSDSAEVPADDSRDPVGFPSSPEEQAVVSECEESVLSELYGDAEKVAASQLMEKVRAQVAEAVAADQRFTETTKRWQECVAAAGYKAESVDDLIAGLGLEGRDTEEAAVVEKEAAVVSFDCAGGTGGIRADLQARVDIVTGVVEQLSAEERAQLLELAR